MPQYAGADKRVFSTLKRCSANTQAGSTGTAPGLRWTAVCGQAAAILLAVTLSVSTEAREVAGVKLDETARLAGIDTPLVLNGAGVRSKFFVKVYVAGLYLQQKTSSVETVLASPGAKRVHMRFIHSEVSAKKFRAGWSDGYRANQSDEALARLAERIERFNGFFPDVKNGDVVDVDYVPDTGTRVRINGESKGVIEGEDFHQATLRIWLGDAPASAGLKKAMLTGP